MGQEPLRLAAAKTDMCIPSLQPSGKHVATGTLGGTARACLLRLQDLMALAQACMSRALTTEECQAYLYAQPCLAAP